MLLGGVIYELPCHIVTLKRAAHVSYGYSILKIVGVV